MKTILTPVDFSDATKAVVTEALALSRALDGRIVLISVIQPPVFLSEYAVLENIAEITVAGEKSVARNLSRLKESIEREKIPVETLQFVGSPIAHIVEQAEKLKADYIVMGSHGHTALYDLLVGSTTHGVMMRTTCPIVVLPATKGKSGKKGK